MNETFQRRQVEWALWQYFSRGRPVPGKPLKVFATRIKRLLELDRGQAEIMESEVPHARYAFFDVDAEGQGKSIPYSPFNAFCLGVGLDLLDIGFKQSEVVFLLRHIRTDLEKQFDLILAQPPAPRQRMAPEDRPDCPTYEEGGNVWADCRVYLIVRKVEMTEVFPGQEARRRRKEPIIHSPVFCAGINALRDEMHRMNHQDRKALVLELAHTAYMVQGFLFDAPIAKRGRGSA